MELIKPESEIPVEDVVEVLLAHLRHNKNETRLATLNWIRHLHFIQPNNVNTIISIKFFRCLDIWIDFFHCS